MKTLHAYYIKQILLYIFLSLLFLCVLYVAIDLISNFRKYGNTLPEILENFSLKFPAIFYQMQAISLFLANTLVLSLIYSRREFLILGTSGISLKKVYGPLIGITLALSLLFCGIYDGVAPKVFVTQQLKRYGGTVGDEYRFSFINTKVWYQEGNRIFHIGYIHSDAGQVDDVQIFFFNDDFSLKKYIQAKRATVTHTDWRFEDGLRVKYRQGTPGLSEAFDEFTQVNFQDLARLKRIQFDPQQLRTDQLLRYLVQGRFHAAERPKYEVSLYERIVFAFFPLLLFFTGAPLISVTRRHTSLLFNVGMTFILSVIFWTSFKIFVTLGTSGKLPPLMATLCVPLAFIVVGGWLWQKKR